MEGYRPNVNCDCECGCCQELSNLKQKVLELGALSDSVEKDCKCKCKEQEENNK